jgi:hypothetical protein
MHASIGSASLLGLAIDYSLNFTLNYCKKWGHLLGNHDGFPDYIIRVQKKKIYHWKQQTIFSLFGSGEIDADEPFMWE